MIHVDKHRDAASIFVKVLIPTISVNRGNEEKNKLIPMYTSFKSKIVRLYAML